MARILIADDELAMREMLAMACRLDGHTVFLAMDTMTAVSAYSTSHPDLLILDLAMPGGGGTEVLHQLRGALGPRLCPVIVVSGYLDSLPSNMRQGLGAHALIEKPFTMDTLRAAVRSALASVPPTSQTPPSRMGPN